MYFYYFTILLLFFPALFETSFPRLRGVISHKKFLIWGVISICIFQMGLRWETGTDWIPYLDHFNKQDISSPFTNLEYSFEPGYTLSLSISKFITPEYSFFLFTNALIFFLLLKRGYEYFTPYSLVAILIFYVSFMGVWGSNRQFVAAGFGILSLTYLYQKKWWAYGLCLFLAFQFHSTSLLLLAFVFFNRKFSSLVIVLALLISIVIGLSPLPFKIFSLFGGVNELTAYKATAYLEQAKENPSDISLVGLLKRILIFSLFFIYRNKISKHEEKFNFIFNGYLLGLCFYFLFAQTLAVMISRGSFYFNILEPILLSYVFYLTNDRKLSFLFMILIFLYCILTLNQSISPYPDLFDPYKGIFINSDYQRTMH